MSARISTLHFNDGNTDQFRKIKCSGICVATGTGSTSWFRTIRSLSPKVVKEVLHKANCEHNYTNKDIEKICFDFNSGLQYPAST